MVKLKYGLLGVGVLSLIVSYLAWLFNHAVGKEDGFFETAGALCLLAASILSAVQYFREPKGNDLMIIKTKRNIFWLLLAILFFFGFGEEVSWGQREFKLATPAALQQLNDQGEINLHNLKVFSGVDATGKKRKSVWGLLLNFDRLFALFWLTFCVLIPAANRLSPPFSRWLARVNLPIVPLGFGILLILNYLLTRVIIQAVGHHLYLVEIKEYNSELIFMTLVCFLWVQGLRRKTAEA